MKMIEIGEDLRMAITNVAIWTGCSAAIIYAIKTTRSAMPLWALLLVPTVIRGVNRHKETSESSEIEG